MTRTAAACLVDWDVYGIFQGVSVEVIVALTLLSPSAMSFTTAVVVLFGVAPNAPMYNRYELPEVPLGGDIETI